MNVREELDLTTPDEFRDAWLRWYDSEDDSLEEAELGFEIARSIPQLLAWIASHDQETASEVVELLATRIEPWSGIGLSNGAGRAEIAEWVRTSFLENSERGSSGIAGVPRAVEHGTEESTSQDD